MLEIIVLTMLVATVINLILSKLHIPSIIGYIATGIIIAYFLQLPLSHSKELGIIAEFGIVFLMFTIGLEFSMHHLVRQYEEVFLYGGLQFGVSMLLFFFIGHTLFDIEIKSMIIIAAALSLSSTAIVLKILNSNRGIGKDYGRRALGILVFQDLMVVPILLIITVFSNEDLSLGALFLQTAFDGLILIVVLWIFGKYILEYFLHSVVKSNSDEIFIASILFLVMGSSMLAHNLGFPYSLGAFIAGMIIAETQYKHQVEADLIPFRDLLLGIFFITIGMQINFVLVWQYIWVILSLLVFLALVKIAIIYLILRWKAGDRVALKTSLTLFQFGEFGLVVFGLASSHKLVDPIFSQILISTIILSMIATPFVLRNLQKIADRILGRAQIREGGSRVTSYSEHIVILGFGRLGRNISEKIERMGLEYIAVESNINNVKEAQQEGKNVIFGSATKKNILDSARINEAALVIVALDNIEKLHLVCTSLQKIAPKANVVIKVDRFAEKERLQKHFPQYEIIVSIEQTARGMVESALACKI